MLNTHEVKRSKNKAQCLYYDCIANSCVRILDAFDVMSVISLKSIPIIACSLRACDVMARFKSFLVVFPMIYV